MQRRLGLEHERVRRLAPEAQIRDGPALRREHEREARVTGCQRLDVVRDERLQQTLRVAGRALRRTRARCDRRPQARCALRRTRPRCPRSRAPPRGPRSRQRLRPRPRARPAAARVASSVARSCGRGQGVELGERPRIELQIGCRDVLLEVAQALRPRDRDRRARPARAPTRSRPGQAWRRCAPRRPARASTIAWFAVEGLGLEPRFARGSRRVEGRVTVRLPVGSPRPSGARTGPTRRRARRTTAPRRRARRVQSESSDCTAVIGWTACARSRVGTSTSESPSARTLPRRELGHGADAVLDRHVRVDPVQVVEVDDVDTETPQRRLAGLADVLGRAVVAPSWVAESSTTRPDLVATTPRRGAGERPADQLLVRERPVHVEVSKQRAAQVDRPVDHVHRLRIVRLAVAQLMPMHPRPIALTPIPLDPRVRRCMRCSVPPVQRCRSRRTSCPATFANLA